VTVRRRETVTVGSVGVGRSGVWYEMLCCIARPSRRQGRAMRGEDLLRIIERLLAT